MSFKKYGGLQFSSNNNYVYSHFTGVNTLVPTNIGLDNTTMPSFSTLNVDDAYIARLYINEYIKFSDGTYITSTANFPLLSENNVFTGTTNTFNNVTIANGNILTLTSTTNTTTTIQQDLSSCIISNNANNGTIVQKTTNSSGNIYDTLTTNSDGLVISRSVGATSTPALSINDTSGLTKSISFTPQSNDLSLNPIIQTNDAVIVCKGSNIDVDNTAVFTNWSATKNGLRLTSTNNTLAYGTTTSLVMNSSGHTVTGTCNFKNYVSLYDVNGGVQYTQMFQSATGFTIRAPYNPAKISLGTLISGSSYLDGVYVENSNHAVLQGQSGQGVDCLNNQVTINGLTPLITNPPSSGTDATTKVATTGWINTYYARLAGTNTFTNTTTFNSAVNIPTGSRMTFTTNASSNNTYLQQFSNQLSIISTGTISVAGAKITGSPEFSIGNTTTTKGIWISSDWTASGYNAMAQTGDAFMLIRGDNIDTGSLTIGTWSSNGGGLRLTSTSTNLRWGNSSNSPNILLDSTGTTINGPTPTLGTPPTDPNENTNKIATCAWVKSVTPTINGVALLSANNVFTGTTNTFNNVTIANGNILTLTNTINTTTTIQQSSSSSCIIDNNASSGTIVQQTKNSSGTSFNTLTTNSDGITISRGVGATSTPALSINDTSGLTKSISFTPQSNDLSLNPIIQTNDAVIVCKGETIDTNNTAVFTNWSATKNGLRLTSTNNTLAFGSSAIILDSTGTAINGPTPTLGTPPTDPNENTNKIATCAWVKSVTPTINGVALLSANNVFTGTTNTFNNVTIANGNILTLTSTINTTTTIQQSSSSSCIIANNASSGTIVQQTKNSSGTSFNTLTTNSDGITISRGVGATSTPALSINDTSGLTKSISFTPQSNDLSLNPIIQTNDAVIVCKGETIDTNNTAVFTNWSATKNGLRLTSTNNTLAFGSSAIILDSTGTAINGPTPTLGTPPTDPNENTNKIATCAWVKSVTPTINGVALLSANNVFTGTTNTFNNVTVTNGNILTLTSTINTTTTIQQSSSSSCIIANNASSGTIVQQTKNSSGTSFNTLTTNSDGITISRGVGATSTPALSINDTSGLTKSISFTPQSNDLSLNPIIQTNDAVIVCKGATIDTNNTAVFTNWSATKNGLRLTSTNNTLAFGSSAIILDSTGTAINGPTPTLGTPPTDPNENTNKIATCAWVKSVTPTINGVALLSANNVFTGTTNTFNNVTIANGNILTLTSTINTTTTIQQSSSSSCIIANNASSGTIVQQTKNSSGTSFNTLTTNSDGITISRGVGATSTPALSINDTSGLTKSISFTPQSNDLSLNPIIQTNDAVIVCKGSNIDVDNTAVFTNWSATKNGLRLTSTNNTLAYGTTTSLVMNSSGHTVTGNCNFKNSVSLYDVTGGVQYTQIFQSATGFTIRAPYNPAKISLGTLISGSSYLDGVYVENSNHAVLQGQSGQGVDCLNNQVTINGLTPLITNPPSSGTDATTKVATTGWINTYYARLAGTNTFTGTTNTFNNVTVTNGNILTLTSTINTTTTIQQSSSSSCIIDNNASSGTIVQQTKNSSGTSFNTLTTNSDGITISRGVGATSTPALSINDTSGLTKSISFTPQSNDLSLNPIIQTNDAVIVCKGATIDTNNTAVFTNWSATKNGLRLTSTNNTLAFGSSAIILDSTGTAINGPTPTLGTPPTDPNENTNKIATCAWVKSVTPTINGVALLSANNVFTGTTNTFNNVTVTNGNILTLTSTINTTTTIQQSSSSSCIIDNNASSGTIVQQTKNSSGTSFNTLTTNSDGITISRGVGATSTPALSINDTSGLTKSISFTPQSNDLSLNPIIQTNDAVIVCKGATIDTNNTAVFTNWSATKNGLRLTSTNNTLAFGSSAIILDSTGTAINGPTPTLGTPPTDPNENTNKIATCAWVKSVTPTINGVALLSANNVFTGTTNTFNNVTVTNGNILTLTSTINTTTTIQQSSSSSCIIDNNASSGTIVQQTKNSSGTSFNTLTTNSDGITISRGVGATSTPALSINDTSGLTKSISFTPQSNDLSLNPIIQTNDAVIVCKGATIDTNNTAVFTNWSATKNGLRLTSTNNTLAYGTTTSLVMNSSGHTVTGNCNFKNSVSLYDVTGGVQYTQMFQSAIDFTVRAPYNPAKVSLTTLISGSSFLDGVYVENGNHAVLQGQSGQGVDCLNNQVTINGLTPIITNPPSSGTDATTKVATTGWINTYYARLDGTNTFSGTNTFNNTTTFNSAVNIPTGSRMTFTTNGNSNNTYLQQSGNQLSIISTGTIGVAGAKITGSPEFSIGNTTTTKGIWISSDWTASGYNSLAQTGDALMLIRGTAVNTGSLTIGTWSDTTSGIRMTSTDTTLLWGNASILLNTTGTTINGPTPTLGTPPANADNSSKIATTNWVRTNTIPFFRAYKYYASLGTSAINTIRFTFTATAGSSNTDNDKVTFRYYIRDDFAIINIGNATSYVAYSGYLSVFPSRILNAGSVETYVNNTYLLSPASAEYSTSPSRYCWSEEYKCNVYPSTYTPAPGQTRFAPSVISGMATLTLYQYTPYNINTVYNVTRSVWFELINPISGYTVTASSSSYSDITNTMV